MPHTKSLVPIFFLALAALVPGCARPWQSPADMARFQRRHYAALASLYPAGTPRDAVMDTTRGRHRATIALPPDADTLDAYAGTPVGFDLPIMAATARHVSGVEPCRVDVLEFFGGPTGMGVEARYIFYDDANRVLAAFGSPWEK